MNARALVTVSILGAVVVACSGAPPSDLYDTSGSSQFGTEPGTDSGTPSVNPGGSGGSGGTGGNGGTGSDAGSVADSGTAVDSGGGGGATGLFCGASGACTSKSQECCATQNGGGGGGGGVGYDFACVSTGTCQGTPITCAGKADCSGNQVCCGGFDPQSGYTSVMCKPQAQCPATASGGLTNVHICDPSAATDECVALGKTCTPSGSLTGFYLCK